MWSNERNVKWLVEYCEKNGIRWDFGIIVFDELSSFKNYQSQRFKFLRKARSYMKRWGCMIGTPSSGVPVQTERRHWKTVLLVIRY